MAEEQHAVPARAHELAWECLGVTVGVGSDDAELIERASALAPPQAAELPQGEPVDHHLTIGHDADGLYSVRYDIRDGVPARDMDAASYVVTDVDRELALGLLDTHLHGAIALRAPGLVFVQGAAVSYRDRAIVLPAMPLTGRTTLVAALVAAGATHYSDEYAVIDEQGRVRPYARPVAGVTQAAETRPLEVGAVVTTSYLPGAEWRPERLSPGAGVLALIAHTVPAQEEPDRTMRAIKRALASEPLILTGSRGEASSVAEQILSEAAALPAGSGPAPA